MKKLLFVFLNCFILIGFTLPTINVPDLTYAHDVENVGLNNADIKGVLINSGKYKVIDKPINQVSNKEESNNTGIDLKNNTDYNLIGEVINVSKSENVYVIDDNRNTLTGLLSVVVSYKLIDNRSNQVLSSFNSNVSGSQTIIFNPKFVTFHQNKPQINSSLLLDETSILLANDVYKNIADQNGISNQPESRTITDYKTYN